MITFLEVIVYLEATNPLSPSLTHSLGFLPFLNCLSTFKWKYPPLPLPTLPWLFINTLLGHAWYLLDTTHPPHFLYTSLTMPHHYLETFHTLYKHFTLSTPPWHFLIISSKLHQNLYHFLDDYRKLLRHFLDNFLILPKHFLDTPKKLLR